MKFFRWLCARCPLNENADRRDADRRKISPAGREQWETWQREKQEIEERLRLVEMQSKVIAHVTNNNR